jgi:serine/threonine protein kinase
MHSHPQGLVKLADFGVATKLGELEDRREDLQQHVVGTPYWMAPEVGWLEEWYGAWVHCLASSVPAVDTFAACLFWHPDPGSCSNMYQMLAVDETWLMQMVSGVHLLCVVLMQVIEMTQVSAASDIWSVGCLIIELLTGSPPYYDLQPMSALFRIVQDDQPPLPDSLTPLLQVAQECWQTMGFAHQG